MSSSSVQPVRSGGRLKSVKERFKQLQNGPLRSLVSIVGTIEQSIRYGSPALIYVDREGDWHNRRREVTLVSPELNVSSWGAVRSAVMDLWCYDCDLQYGHTVVDIGAGIGDDAVVFSRRVGEKGRVIAIEAHPRTYRCLLKTIAANRLDNVIAINAAISDETGYLTISDGGNFLSNTTHAGAGTIRIDSRKLDDLLDDIGSSRPDLIKMNIEGAETAALLGMKETLSRTPHIVVSCHDFKFDRGEGAAFRTYDAVTQILLDAGFDLRRRKDDSRPEVRYYLYGSKEVA